MSYHDSRIYIHRSIIVQMIKVLVLLSMWLVVRFSTHIYGENSVRRNNSHHSESVIKTKLYGSQHQNSDHDSWQIEFGKKKNQKEKWNQIKDFNFNQNIIPLAKLQNNDLAKSLIERRLWRREIERTTKVISVMANEKMRGDREREHRRQRR
jgi:hypothetical protein